MQNLSQSKLKYNYKNIFDDSELIIFNTIATTIFSVILIYFLGKSNFETWYSIGGFFLIIFWLIKYLKYQDFKRSATNLWELLSSKVESPISAHHLFIVNTEMEQVLLGKIL